MGRPSTYTEEIAEEILARLAQGESLRFICKDEHMPERRTVAGWAVRDVNGFAAQYTHARDIGLDAMVEAALEEASTARKARLITEKPDGIEVRHVDAVDRSRLKVDTIKWYASKIANKRYGDKLEIDANVNVDMASTILNARKRSGGG
jgi:hypothetical protein